MPAERVRSRKKESFKDKDKVLQTELQRQTKIYTKRNLQRKIYTDIDLNTLIFKQTDRVTHK